MVSASFLPVFAVLAMAKASAQVATLGGSGTVGSWESATVTQSDVNLLVQVAGNATYFGGDTDPVCLIAVQALQTQSVAGTNYKFQVAACAVDSTADVGACTDRDCDQATYDIVIYEQTWTNTLELSSVTQQE